MSQTEKRKPKLVRGWSLSPENQMALNAEAKDLTLERTDGKTTSGSSVLDAIVTKWRKERERRKGLDKAVRRRSGGN